MRLDGHEQQKKEKNNTHKDIIARSANYYYRNWYLVDISIKVSNLWIPLMLDML
ncbi:MAG: hypothetical protein M3264_02240 [Thermoproteota archaeon]|nr:hypothetical protein [Thermoproteota archaeon]